MKPYSLSDRLVQSIASTDEDANAMLRVIQDLYDAAERAGMVEEQLAAHLLARDILYAQRDRHMQSEAVSREQLAFA